jgi:hypothetical protein
VKKARFKNEQNCLCPFLGQISGLIGGMPLSGKSVGVKPPSHPIQAVIGAYYYNSVFTHPDFSPGATLVNRTERQVA